MLKDECFSSLLDVSGPWMTVLSLHNWVEPLLNPKTPLFISNARSYLLKTSISTNLSVKFDIDALLDSGFDYLLVSIDGASQSVYEKYRVGGTLSLALSNLENLTSRRSQLPDCYTFIVWRFLVFEHNRHEMEQVESIAKDIGFDMLMFTDPYDVSGINPEITKPEQPLSRNCIYRPLGTCASDSLSRAGRAGRNPRIDMVWEDGWQSRYLGQEESSTFSKTCKWL
jgi:hypothetical protein